MTRATMWRGAQIAGLVILSIKIAIGSFMIMERAIATGEQIGYARCTKEQDTDTDKSTAVEHANAATKRRHTIKLGLEIR